MLSQASQGPISYQERGMGTSFPGIFRVIMLFRIMSQSVDLLSV